jgi:hypothetical protein
MVDPLEPFIRRGTIFKGGHDMHTVQTVARLTLVAFFLPWALSPEQSTSELQFRASVSQSAFMVGEPVIVQAVLTNAGTSVLHFPGDDLSVDTQAIRIAIRSESGVVRLYLPGSIRDPSRAAYLQPGESLTSLTDITMHRRQGGGVELMLPEPGKYSVTVQYIGFLGEVSERPAPATFDVVVRSATAQLGADVFAGEAVWRFIGGGADKDQRQEAVRKLTGLSASEGEHPFQLYARYYLGGYESAAGPGKPKNLARAAELLTQVDREGFQMRDLALLKLAEVNLERRLFTEARVCAEKAIKLSSRLTVKEKASQILARTRKSETAPVPRSRQPASETNR